MIRKIYGLAILSLLASAASASEPTSLGCYKSAGDLFSLGDHTYKSITDCWKACSDKAYPVFALHNGAECFCGNKVPPAKALTDTSHCNVPCKASSDEYCGGHDTWTVLLDPSSNIDELSNLIATDIITASDPSTNDPTASFNINPTIIETGIQIATSDAQDPKTVQPTATATTTTIPKSILTAPTGADEIPDIQSLTTSTRAGMSSSSAATPTPTDNVAVGSQPFGVGAMAGSGLAWLVVQLVY